MLLLEQEEWNGGSEKEMRARGKRDRMCEFLLRLFCFVCSFLFRFPLFGIREESVESAFFQKTPPVTPLCTPVRF